MTIFGLRATRFTSATTAEVRDQFTSPAQIASGDHARQIGVRLIEGAGCRCNQLGRAVDVPGIACMLADGQPWKDFSPQRRPQALHAFQPILAYSSFQPDQVGNAQLLMDNVDFVGAKAGNG